MRRLGQARSRPYKGGLLAGVDGAKRHSGKRYKEKDIPEQRGRCASGRMMAASRLQRTDFELVPEYFHQLLLFRVAVDLVSPHSAIAGAEIASRYRNHAQRVFVHVPFRSLQHVHIDNLQRVRGVPVVDQDAELEVVVGVTSGG